MPDPKTYAGFRQHVSEGRFSIVRQPVIDLITGEALHDEWLVRFDADELLEGLLRPAEISGAIADLDLSMLKQAIKTLNMDKRRKPIAVNLSGASMADPEFSHHVLTALSAFKSDPKRLIFELTETWNMKNLTLPEQTLSMLSERGHPLCLDDVGAGAASIRYLRAFKTDWLKIDGDFVQAAMSSQRELVILRAILSLKTPLGVKIIAEGIENEAIEAFAKKEGFDAAQGYALGAPEEEPLRKV